MTKREKMLAARAERLTHANQLIQIMAKHGRRFFYNRTHDRVAHFSFDARGRVLFHDDFTGKAIYTPKPGCWVAMGFSHGGNLRFLVEEIAAYIQHGELLGRWLIGPERQAGGNIWGYPQADIEACRAEAYALPMFATE